MDSLTATAKNILSTPQNVIIVILVVAVIIMVYRDRVAHSKDITAPRDAPEAEPSVDKLLDKLEESGAVKQTHEEDAK